jgi:hypothetical protein
MMRRQEWRDLVAQILSDGLPLVYGRVFKARVWPLQLPELPAVLVYGWQETKSRKTLDVWTHQFEVTCSIAIEGRIHARNGDDAEIALESMARDIETALLTSPLLLGMTTALERIDRVETKIEAHTAETVQGAVSMAFDFVWTETHQAVVPAGETTENFAIKSYPTIY